MDFPCSKEVFAPSFHWLEEGVGGGGRDIPLILQTQRGGLPATSPVPFPFLQLNMTFAEKYEDFLVANAFLSSEKGLQDARTPMIDLRQRVLFL